MEHFKSSAEYEAVKRRQDRLTYLPGFVLGMLCIGDAFIGEHFGTGPMLFFLVPLAVVAVIWSVLLIRASVRTWRTLAAEQREWKAHRQQNNRI
ncbi:MAG: hypothetical protein ACXVXJ_08175 [Mycobacteriaceae bacterium]